MEIKEVLDTNTGQFYKVDAETGRRLHPFEEAAEELQKDGEAKLKTIAEIEADDSSRRKAERLPKAQADFENFLDQTLGSAYVQATQEFEAVMEERRSLLMSRRLDDPLNQGSGVVNALAEVEGLAGMSRNLDDFTAAYERALKSDPYLTRAFQVKGGAIAATRWAQSPGVGSFAKRLERDRLSYYENDESRALLTKAETIGKGVEAVRVKVSDYFHRKVNGAKIPGGLVRAIQELEWTIGSYVADQGGASVMGSEEGRSGGIYLPKAANDVIVMDTSMFQDRGR